MGDDNKWQRRFERERKAREQAEKLLEEKSSQLFLANSNLKHKVEFESSRFSDESEKFKRLFHSSINGIVICNTSGVILEANSSAGKIFRVPHLELLDQRLEEFYSETSKVRLKEAFVKLVQKGRSKFELDIIPSSGEKITTEISATLFEYSGDYIVQGIIRDITEEKEQAARLQKATRDALDASKAKSLFLATMSHEIRTPLNGILGFTDILLHNESSSEKKRQLQIIKKSGDNLLHIINDILDFSRIESKQIELEKVDFDLLQCIEETLDIQAQAALQREVELLYHIEPSVPRKLNGDVGRLQQVLLNLVSNGLKFTEKGSVIIRVSQVSEKMISFCVIDTGIGFNPEIAARLFEAFHQADASTTRKFGGTGLGLAICKQLLEVMGGSISAKSTIGKGSEFTVLFPIQLAKDPSNLTLPQSNLKGLQILVVDDHPINLEYMETRLNQWGCGVTLASSGEEALKILKSNTLKFDILLLDMLMPEMDGLQLGSEIMQTIENPPPMLLITSSQLDGEIDQALRVGFKYVAYKPIREKELHRIIIKTLLHSKKKKKENTSTPSVSESQNRKQFILIVEDNSTNALLAKLLIERTGRKAHIAQNGAAAIDALIIKPIYDLILMDMQMPVMDGVEATTKIRDGAAGSIYKDIPIIAMTANALVEDRNICIEAGMNDFITKPIAIEKLTMALDTFIPT